MASVLSIVNFLVMMAACGVFQTLLAVCPPGWLAWQDACYVLLPDRMNWWQAKEVCDRPGSSLVVPDSQEEHDFVWREMKVKMADHGATGTGDFEMWIGCSVNGGSVSCIGDSGQPIYKNFGSGEPNMPDACVRMREYNDCRWADWECDASKYAACEMSASRVFFCMPTDTDGQCPPHCLLNHVIKSPATGGATGCAYACWEEPRCHSFNLLQKEGNAGICQLNNATRLQAANEDFNYVEECYFYEM